MSAEANAKIGLTPSVSQYCFNHQITKSDFFCDQAILILTTSIKGHFRDFLTISDNREVRRDQMTQVQILDVGQYHLYQYPDKCCVLDNDTSSDFEALPFHVQTEEMRSTETSFQLCTFRL